MTGRPPPADRSESLLGALLELDVGPVAHGGHCVARLGDDPHGRVIFVRHSLPGERVRARVTEDAGGSFARADAVEVVRASAARVDAPCAHAGPGRCGGCDWQHADPAAQRALKTQVVREQFARLAGLEVDVEVAELPGGPLHWRTRIGYSLDREGRVGLLRHRSPTVELIDECPLGVSGVGDSPVLAQSWPGAARVEVVRDDVGSVSVLTQARPAAGPDSRSADRNRQRRRPPPPPSPILVEGPDRLRHVITGAGSEPITFDVSPGGFWQVHPAAAQTFVDTVLRELRPAPGERVLDLYAGAGLFTSVFAHAVGADGQVIGLELDAQAVVDAGANLASLDWAEVRRSRVSARALSDLELDPALVILDPPRSGAGAEVIEAALSLGARAMAYVACDPASLARDTATMLAGGWGLGALYAFDAFPMTHHIECIAIFRPN